MDLELLPRPSSEHRAPPCSESESAIALLLEGSSSLGVTQSGVLRALREGGPQPCWALGLALGACYAALIVGNPPGARLSRIAEFSAHLSPLTPPAESQGKASAQGTDVPTIERKNLWLAWLQSTLGAAVGTKSATTRRIRAVLPRLIDFDRINRAETRLTLGAMDAAAGGLVWFDNTERAITPEQVIRAALSPVPSEKTVLAPILAWASRDLSFLRIAPDGELGSGAGTRSSAAGNPSFALIYSAAPAQKLEAAAA